MSMRPHKFRGSRAKSLAGSQAQLTSPEHPPSCAEITDPSREASAPRQRLLHLPRPAIPCTMALPAGATKWQNPFSSVLLASGLDRSVSDVTGSTSTTAPNSLVSSCGGSTPASWHSEYQGSCEDSQLSFVVKHAMSPVRGRLRPHHCRHAKTLCEPALAMSAQATSPNPFEKSLCWRRGAEIGKGSYGCVYKAHNTETGQIFAVKQAVLAQGDEDDRRFRDRLEAELRICQELRHPHIVSYLGHCYEATRLCIFLEYMPGGSLASLLSEFGPVVGTPFRTATRALLEGLDYLHTRSPPVLHRDIKAANVLVDLDFCVKLADFGCSKHEAVTRSFTMLGSIPWIAPEVIQQQDGYGRKADIWSFGCTLIEMGTAEKPWGRNTFDNIMYALQHIGLSDNTPPLPDEMCNEGRDLISRCIRRNPEEQPWAEEVLQHPFVAGLA